MVCVVVVHGSAVDAETCRSMLLVIIVSDIILPSMFTRVGLVRFEIFVTVMF